MSVKLSTPLKEALKTTGYHLKRLEMMGITTVRDLLLYFPRTHEDLSKFVHLAEVNIKEINIVKGKLLDPAKIRTKNGYQLIKARFQDELGMSAEVVWFNQQHLFPSLKNDMSCVIIGKAKYEFGKITFVSPKIETITPGKELFFAGTIAPIYPEADKLSSDWFLQKMKQVIKAADEFVETLPQELLKEYDLMPRGKAIREVHFPTSTHKLEEAKARLAFEELFFLQLKALYRKITFQKGALDQAPKVTLDAEFIKEYLATLPFQLTEHQKIAVFQILKDMEKGSPMTRLLQGDVGSGKTIVAQTAAIHAIKKGEVQVALMAPTEVLASQHYKKIAPVLAGFGINTKFLSGSLTQKEKDEVVLGLRAGTIDLVIGTHALIQDPVDFLKLGLVVIDEQHRFGVEQRRNLASHGFPHVLHMTATPIPRTLTLTMYGDQDVSVISQMPAGRQPIKTKIVAGHQKEQMYRFIDDQIGKGRQAFVICPLIEESEKLEDVRAATKEYNFLQQHIFPKLKLALLHGKMKAQEKDQIMQDFKDKKYDILVSTSVIEVGIDIPNATVILIEGAERFGLSQLHQFRGRVGRSDMQSYCFLSTDKAHGGTSPRLRAMEKHTDGFRLAEIDLELRGPGEVYGIRQSGIPDLKMASFMDLDAVLTAREAAEKILEVDPTLKKWPELSKIIQEEDLYLPE